GDDQIDLAVAVEVGEARRLGADEAREALPAAGEPVGVVPVDDDARRRRLGDDELRPPVAVDVGEQLLARLLVLLRRIGDDPWMTEQELAALGRRAVARELEQRDAPAAAA